MRRIVEVPACLPFYDTTMQTRTLGIPHHAAWLTLEISCTCRVGSCSCRHRHDDNRRRHGYGNHVLRGQSAKTMGGTAM